MARGRLLRAHAALAQVLRGLLVLGREVDVLGGLALEALGLGPVLLCTGSPLLGGVGALARSQRVGLELLAVAAGLGVEPRASAVTLGVASRRNAVDRPPGKRGDEQDNDDDHDGHGPCVPARTRC